MAQLHVLGSVRSWKSFKVAPTNNRCRIVMLSCNYATMGSLSSYDCSTFWLIRLVQIVSPLGSSVLVTTLRLLADSPLGRFAIGRLAVGRTAIGKLPVSPLAPTMCLCLFCFVVCVGCFSLSRLVHASACVNSRETRWGLTFHHVCREFGMRGVLRGFFACAVCARQGKASRQSRGFTSSHVHQLSVALPFVRWSFCSVFCSVVWQLSPRVRLIENTICTS